MHAGWLSCLAGYAKTVVLTPFIHKCDLFYQDKLGTNIGKLRKDYRFLRAPGPAVHDAQQL
jgi:hypothetical protein